MRNIKARIYWTKIRLQDFGVIMIDKISTSLIILIAVPFLILGAFLDWFSKIFGEEK